jgi:hypothetical protein
MKNANQTFKPGDLATYLGMKAEIIAVNDKHDGNVTYDIFYFKNQNGTELRRYITFLHPSKLEK